MKCVKIGITTQKLMNLFQTNINTRCDTLEASTSKLIP